MRFPSVISDEAVVLGQMIIRAPLSAAAIVVAISWAIAATIHLGLLSKLVACLVQLSFQLPPLRQIPAGLTSQSFTLNARWPATAISGWVLTSSARKSAKPCDAVAVLVHGWGQDRRDLLNAAPAYSRRDFCVVVYDARWRGGLSWGSSEAQDAADVIRWVWDAAVPPRVVLVHGMSQGAVAAAVAVGLLGAKSSALILESPFASPSAMLDHLSTSEAGLNLLPIPDSLKRVLVAASWSLQQAAVLFRIPTALSAARAITVPTLVLASRGDPLVPVVQTLEVSEALHQAEFTQIEICEGCDHHAAMANVDRQKWEKTLDKFLTRANFPLAINRPPP